MKSYIIHFIRHGSIDETLSGKYIGTTDVPLSDKGKIELRKHRLRIPLSRLSGGFYKSFKEMYADLQNSLSRAKSACHRQSFGM